MNSLNFIIKENNEVNLRLDKFLVTKLVDFNLSRSFIQSLIEKSHILLNDKSTDKSIKLKLNDRIEVNLVLPQGDEILPENIKLNIIYEDEYIIVINKPSGMVSHPGSGNFSGTLVNALLHHCKNLSTTGGDDRRGLVHRLDKDTSGCIVTAKTNEVHKALSDQFANRTIKKQYLALVDGKPAQNDGFIESYLGRNENNRLKITNYDTISDRNLQKGKLAQTKWSLLYNDVKNKISLIRCFPKTGRTHQLRVHLKENLRCPILGDVIYETRESARKSLNIGIKRLMLHAEEITLTHPITQKIMNFKCDFKGLDKHINFFLNK